MKALDWILFKIYLQNLQLLINSLYALDATADWVNQKSVFCLPLPVFQSAFTAIHEKLSHSGTTSAQANFSRFYHKTPMRKLISIFSWLFWGPKQMNIMIKKSKFALYYFKN